MSKTLTITAKMVTCVLILHDVKRKRKKKQQQQQSSEIPKDNELWLSNEELQDASRLVYCEQTAGGFEIAF